MKKWLWLCMLLTGLAMARPAAASEEELRKELDQLRKTIDWQIKKIAELEDDVKVVADPVRKDIKDVWLPASKEKIRVGGEIEVEFKYAEFDDDPALYGAGGVNSYFSGSSGPFRNTFDIDKTCIYIDAKWNDVVSSYIDIEMGESGAFIDSAWVQFDIVKTDANDFHLRTGYEHQFFRPSRSTETYPLAGAMFWRDEFTQARFYGHHSLGWDKKWLYWYAMVGNSLNLNDTNGNLGKNAIFANDLLQDDNVEFLDLDGHFQWGVGAGINPDFKEYGKWDVFGWYNGSELRDDVVGNELDMIADRFFTSNGLPVHSHLGAPTPTGTNTLHEPGALGTNADTDKNHWGARVRYENKFFDGKVAFHAVGEYIDAENGPVELDVWYVEAGLKFKWDGIAWGKDEKFFTAIQPIVRYDQLDIDDDYDNQFAQPVTWDRTRWVVAANVDVCKNVLLRFEYLMQDEEIDWASGGRTVEAAVDDVDNDEFVCQLEVKF